MASHQIKVIAGDYGTSNNSQFVEKSWIGGAARFKLSQGMLTPSEELYLQYISVEQYSEDLSKQLKGTLGWAAVGGLLTGGIGLIAGALLGGNGGKVMFVVTHASGKQALCECSKSTWAKIQAAKWGDK